MVKIRYDMAWGNPFFLLEILNGHYYPQLHFDVTSLIYGPYEGTQELIDVSHKVIKETTGNVYKHLLITNGASSAVNMLLRFYKERGVEMVFTTKYGYPSYEEMIRRAGLIRICNLNHPLASSFTNPDGVDKVVRLIDSPDNPLGKQFSGGSYGRDIWDNVYHNIIYTQDKMTQPTHRFLVGSYSKLLGVAGARIGFIATNDRMAYEALLAQSVNETAGVSRLSQSLIVDIMKKLDLNRFMEMGRDYLFHNKGEFQKLEYLFDGQPLNEAGMFYSPKADPKAVDLLDRVGVGYVRLDDETIRISMGQTKDIVKDGIKAILKEDRK